MGRDALSICSAAYEPGLVVSVRDRNLRRRAKGNASRLPRVQVSWSLPAYSHWQPDKTWATRRYPCSPSLVELSGNSVLPLDKSVIAMCMRERLNRCHS